MKRRVTSRRVRVGLALAAAAVVGAALGSCAADPSRGYSLASTYDASVETVGVAMFDNQTFVPGLGPALTEAVAKRIQASTPWRLADPDRADTVISGTIRDRELNRLSSDPDTGLVLEEALTLRVDFAWIDNATGRRLAERRGFSASSIFIPTRGTGERIEVGERQAIEEIAEAIVEELRGEW